MDGRAGIPDVLMASVFGRLRVDPGADNCATAGDGEEYRDNGPPEPYVGVTGGPASG